MARKQKQYFYVIVCDNGKLKFVTEVNDDERTCSWDMSEGKKPYKFYSWMMQTICALALPVI